MANSKYEYVKSFEVEDKLMPSTWIVLRIQTAVNSTTTFVLKKTTEFYNRRSTKIVSITVSFYTSVYSTPFDARTVCYPSTKILRDYSWRQVDCHINNQYNTCFWKLIESGKTKSEAQDRLKGTRTQDKNEILFQLGVNYTELPAIFREGSFVFKDKVEETVKYNEDGKPVKRPRNKVIADHCDIIGDKFWNDHVNILKEDKKSSQSTSAEAQIQMNLALYYMIHEFFWY
ncbi:hypothetical protein MKX01_041989 [Papaver californicum]|nr:hypothetical protein MKX01_041989 [Papaver californicum]